MSSSSNSPAARPPRGPGPAAKRSAEAGRTGLPVSSRRPRPPREEAETPKRAAARLRRPAHQQHRARAHVLLLAHHLGHALGAVGREGLVGCSSRSAVGLGGDGAHGRRQVEQPARVDREPAHHLQRGGGVRVADPHPRAGMPSRSRGTRTRRRCRGRRVHAATLRARRKTEGNGLAGGGRRGRPGQRPTTVRDIGARSDGHRTRSPCRRTGCCSATPAAGIGVWPYTTIGAAPVLGRPRVADRQAVLVGSRRWSARTGRTRGPGPRRGPW